MTQVTNRTWVRYIGGAILVIVLDWMVWFVHWNTPEGVFELVYRIITPIITVVWILGGIGMINVWREQHRAPGSERKEGRQ